jgi:hypothetical protein
MLFQGRVSVLFVPCFLYQSDELLCVIGFCRKIYILHVLSVNSNNLKVYKGLTLRY